MSNFKKIKTIETATKTVIKDIREAEGTRLAYALQVISIMITKPTEIKHIDNALTAFTADETARTAEGEKQSRIHKDLKSLLNNCKKYGNKLKEIDTEGMTFNELMTAVASLNPKKETVKKKGDIKAPNKSPKAPNKSPKAPPKVPNVDVKNVVQNERNKFINHSKELAKLSKGELRDNILALLAIADEMKLEKMTVERLAVIQNHLEAVVA